MTSEVVKRLRAIEDQLERGAAAKEFANTPLWGGADVIIATEIDDRIERWLVEEPLVFSDQETEPARRAVITPHAQALSWLFCQVRDALYDHVDSVTKYDLYGSLAQAALDLIREDDRAPEKDLLLAVLASARSYAESIGHGR